jgi:hypothetical protein
MRLPVEPPINRARPGEGSTYLLQTQVESTKQLGNQGDFGSTGREQPPTLLDAGDGHILATEQEAKAAETAYLPKVSITDNDESSITRQVRRPVA